MENPQKVIQVAYKENVLSDFMMKPVYLRLHNQNFKIQCIMYPLRVLHDMWPLFIRYHNNSNATSYSIFKGKTSVMYYQPINNSKTLKKNDILASV